MYIANNITTALYKNLARNNYLKNKDSKTCGLEPNTILHMCLKDNTVNQGFVAPCKETGRDSCLQHTADSTALTSESLYSRHVRRITPLHSMVFMMDLS